MKKFKNATMNDIFAGIIVAFISIPISMGYAQVAGLPMVYGLYGSLVPILVFSFFTTSHDFVFGVDAALRLLLEVLLHLLVLLQELKKQCRWSLLLHSWWLYG